MYTVATLCLVYLTAITIQAIHRVFLHSLRKFPGPWVAAATHYYRAYYDIVKGGAWTEHMVELHERYGPVVRVSPSELHFSDPKAFDDIHVVPKPLKDHHFYRALATQDAIVTIIDPKEASKRRVRVGSYFSRRAVLQLEQTIQKNINKLIARLTSEPYSGDRPADLLYAYRATTMDIIMSYLFAQEFGALDYPGFAHPLLVSLDGIIGGTWIMYYLQPLGDLMKILPESVIRKLNPMAAPLLDQVHHIDQKVEELTLKAVKDTADSKAIFHVWMDKANGSDPWNVPKSQIMDECTSMQLAGSDTVGNACMIGTFHILRKRMTLTKLRRELDALCEEQMTFEALAKLPYLATIKESLRLSHGVASPLPRVVGPSGSAIAGVTVPPGAVVSSAAYIVHTNPIIFPDPQEFVPERWLDNRELDKYLVAFSKGPRICLGVNLAWAELYLIFANVFRRLEFELHDAP
ncbi:hypothetical protein PQX77_014623 [Marasmius sp. AFHP31]|nr:hypothetical protein PQX77_019059 [Marasmius sp. AFHP31]KAK1222509.1 hypothetical protein PQX77_014623 [Marasmius sp. AFHP31]